ncbi:hypothetical protein BKA81DRAFT_365076 [Phyllosticta paracitricarpa]
MIRQALLAFSLLFPASGSRQLCVSCLCFSSLPNLSREPRQRFDRRMRQALKRLTAPAPSTSGNMLLPFGLAHETRPIVASSSRSLVITAWGQSII